MPPRLVMRLFRWYCHPKLVDDIEGDLLEVYNQRLRKIGKRKADIQYTIDVLLLFRSGIIRPLQGYKNLNTYGMYKSYVKIGWRNLWKSKGYSMINIGGLAVGMGVSILIGLWIWSELSFNKNFENYGRIGQVWQFVKFGAEKSSYNVVPIPLGEELREKYPEFESVSVSGSRETVLSTEQKKFVQTGNYVEPDFISMMSVKVIAGSPNALKDRNSIMLSRSLAKNFFGMDDPLNKVLTVNNNQSLKVAAVYEDFPANSTFKDVHFMAAWEFFVTNDEDARNSKDQWDANSYQIYVQLRAGADFENVSAKIKDIRMKRDNPPGYKPEFFVHPMSKWHLYADFKDGKNTGGLIEYVWLFGMAGMMVLILACINFMNLATARSEKRAREVGIRKSIGSVRGQLITQFFTESFLVVLIGFALSLALVQLAIPSFSEISQKEITILWTNPWFWIFGIAFSLITGFLAGCYPALYLSSFLPVKVLKGTFRAGRFASVPRKFLVVLQFTVSIALMIGITVIFRQIQFAKNRPVGYDRSSLIELNVLSSSLRKQLDPFREDLLKTGYVTEMAASYGSITAGDYGGTTNVSWAGKTPDSRPLLMSNRVTCEYGKTIGWQLVAGRDFSRDIATDNASMIINEAALALMGLKNPLEELVTFSNKQYRIIGIMKDMIKESPFKPVSPSFFILDNESVNTIAIKLDAQKGVHDAIAAVAGVFKKYDPESPFEYQFADDGYARKFSVEQRIGKLAGIFAVLALFISALGVFGLASFVAEQRTKEIGIRKVLGASVFSLWRMLSRDFVLLVCISFLLAIPVGYYYMSNWLVRFEYRIEISWWIFAASGVGAVVITLLTVSFQSIRAARMNPVKSLRSE